MHTLRKSSLVLALVLAACGGNGGTPPPQTAVFTTLTVAPANPTMVDGDTLQLTATPLDQNGNPMSGLPAATFTLTSGTSVMVSTSGRVIAQQPGSSVVTASLTSGTTTRTATSTPNVNALETTATVTASGTGSTFSPATAKIAAGGTVTWTFPGPEIHNVTFSAASPPGGDIPNNNSGSVPRTFPAAGNYPYHCTRHTGMNGTVNVRTP